MVCLNCGTEQDRDVSASANILAAGQADLNGQTLSCVRPYPGEVACWSTCPETI
ncbi:hypothetical protein K4A83_17495 [Spirulina subsalsa FACHB-351]|uniref:Uncharacterized protein n=1 Tax=Spirulina subsalsa FACHB-351 TaxID=234711 RepID=A0ABT3L958_9CYAN|nr:hypothetical protein [Spirulina subsalsa]MCW6038053.1 hypothetical protein [Spirulina subsalsa FACHB-351]